MTELTPLNYPPQQRNIYQGVLPSAPQETGLPEFMNELVLDSPKPQNLKCYHCGANGQTKIIKHYYYFTNACAGLICLFACPCFMWLPFMFDACKEHHHHCKSCEHRIGVYTRLQNHNECHK